MPLVIAPMVAFALGVLFAFALGEGPSSSRLAFARRSVGLFAVFVFAPAAAYPVWALPDWSMAYAVDGSSLPSALGLLAVVASAALVRGGFELARRAIGEGKQRQGLALGFGAALVATVVLSAVGSRFGKLGTWAEFHGGFPMATLLSSIRGGAVAAEAALLAIGAWLTATALRGGLPSRGETRPRVSSTRRR